MTEEEDEGTGNCASELRSAESQRSARALKSHSFTFVATHSNSPPIRTRTNCSHRTNFLRTPTFRTRQLSLSLSATAMSDEQFNVQGYNIVTILKRLEAATSRLEDITIFQDEVTRSNDDVASLSLSKSKAISSKDIPGNSTNSVPSAPPAPPAQPTPEDPKFVNLLGLVDERIHRGGDEIAKRKLTLLWAMPPPYLPTRSTSKALLARGSTGQETRHGRCWFSCTSQAH